MTTCLGELFIQFTASAFRKLLLVYVFSYFPFGIEGRVWDLIVSVPDHCLSFYFGQGTSSASIHKVVHMLLYCKNLIGMNRKIIYADSSEFPAKCPCAFVYIYLC